LSILFIARITRRATRTFCLVYIICVLHKWNSITPSL
jgi:hypothetical protein